MVETFGQRLRRLRTERGWSQDELRQRAGLARGNYIKDYEYDSPMAKLPRQTALEKLAAVFNMTPDELMHGN